MVKILLNICLLVLLIEPIFSQGEVVEGKFYGVERDFDSKKYGITNKNGDTIVPFKYDLLSMAVTGVFKAKKEGKFGIIDSNNRILVDFIYDELYQYHPYFVTVRKSKNSDGLNLCSVIDTGYVTIISERENYNKIVPVSSTFEWKAEFAKRNIVFKANNFRKHQVSLLFKNGEVDKTYPYDDIIFMDNYLKVKMNDPKREADDLEGLIDWNGKILLKPKYEYIGWVNKELVCLYEKSNSNAQIIDLKTKKVKVDKYPSIMAPELNGCMIIRKFDDDLEHHGIINSKFEEIHPMCNCTIYYDEQENIFKITDNLTKKVEILRCN